MKRLLIEIKARCGDHGPAREALVARGAECRGTDHQVDTYFRVQEGRLKLREGQIENHLIFYRRDDQEGPKESRVILFATEPGSPLKEMLAGSLGVLVVVDKQREIYFIGNVKFHLDTVAGLGSFVEIEAIGSDEAEREHLRAQCEEYLALLGIRDPDLIAGSYSDLLREGSKGS